MGKYYPQSCDIRLKEEVKRVRSVYWILEQQRDVKIQREAISNPAASNPEGEKYPGRIGQSKKSDPEDAIANNSYMKKKKMGKI